MTAADEAEFVHHSPCEECGSSDARAVYSDASTHCFSCLHHTNAPTDGSAPLPAKTTHPAAKALLHGDVKPLPARRLHAEVCKKYGYRVGVFNGKGCQIADYYNAKGQRCAQKVRFPDKKFVWVGRPKEAVLFGQQLFRDGGKKIVITEGEIDALTMSQVQGNRWPVVSLKDGAASATKSLSASIEWLEGYEEIILMFDSDEPGQEAATNAAELFTPGKAKIAILPGKDPNEMLQAGEAKKLISAMWEAKTFRPDGILAGLEVIDRVLAPPPPSIAYPWPDLNDVLRGQRRGEITTWCAGSGTGKSQLVREVAHHLRKEGEKVGVIALEESVRKAALSQVSIEMNVRLHEPEERAKQTDEAIRAAADVALRDIFFYEHFGSVEAEVLIPKIRYMAKGLGVSWVILDHLSIMVSGSATDGDERKRIDELMTKLRTSVEGLNIGMHLVSHLRKATGTPHEEGGRITLDDLRGSGAIKQVSDNIVAAERDQQAEDDDERNLTQLRVLKCREFGETGPAGKVSYSRKDGRIRAAEAFVPSGEGEGAPEDDGGFF